MNSLRERFNVCFFGYILKPSAIDVVVTAAVQNVVPIHSRVIDIIDPVAVCVSDTCTACEPLHLAESTPVPSMERIVEHWKNAIWACLYLALLSSEPYLFSDVGKKNRPDICSILVRRGPIALPRAYQACRWLVESVYITDGL